MNVSSIQSSEHCLRRNLFIKYANSFMSAPDNEEAIEKTALANHLNNKKIDKTMGIETLTIFPKQVINGKTVITA